MNDQVNEDIEIASSSIVKQAARDFAAALAETPQFKAFEQAAYAFHNDQAAQKPCRLCSRNNSHCVHSCRLNALSNTQREELLNYKVPSPASRGTRIFLCSGRTDYVMPGVGRCAFWSHRFELCCSVCCKLLRIGNSHGNDSFSQQCKKRLMCSSVIYWRLRLLSATISHKPSSNMILRHRLYSTSFPRPKADLQKSRLKAACRRKRLIP